MSKGNEVDAVLARDVVEAVMDVMFWRGPVDGGNYDEPIWLNQALELVHPDVARAYRRELGE